MTHLKGAVMLVAVLAVFAGASSAWAQTIAIDPPSVSDPALAPGSAVVVHVLATVSAVNGVDFTVKFDSTVLQFVYGTTGNFFAFGSGPFILADDVVAGSPGTYWFAAVILGGSTGSGAYTVVTLNFKVLAVGSTSLAFSGGIDVGGTVPIFTNPGAVPAVGVTNGSFANVAASVIDVAVSGVTPSSTTSSPVGSAVTLSATVTNLGTGPAACTVNFTAGGLSAGSASVTGLAAGASTSVSVSWSTTGLALGSYAISASIPPLPGESVTSNNTASGGTVWLTVAPNVTLAGKQAWAGKNFIHLSTTSTEDLFGKVKNVGGAPATVRVKFTITKDGVAYDTEYSATATIFPGLSAVLSDSFAALTAGVGAYSVTSIAQANIGGAWTDQGSSKTFGFSVNP